jgi:hypothetical protein
MLISSVRSCDEHVHRFLSGFEAFSTDSKSTTPTDLLNTVSALRDAPIHLIVRMHIVILNELFAILSASKSVQVSRATFQTIIHVVDCVSSVSADSANQRNELLDSYVHHFYAQPSKNLPYALLPQQVTAVSHEEAMHARVELYCWFVFDVIIKSAALALGNDMLQDESNRSQRLTDHAPAFFDELRDMIGALAQQIRNNVDVQEGV